MWRDIKRIIQQGQRFVLTTHVNPDGDGIGSACALIELLMQMGKKVKFVCDCPIPEKFAFLDFHKCYSSYESAQELLPFDVLIVLDTYKEDRIGKVAELLQIPGITAVCIDHHLVKDVFTSHAVIDPHACSVGAMIYTLYKESGYELNLQAAMGIYTSVISDTGRFSYASTSRKAHKLADECLKVGVDPSDMFAKLFQQIPLDYIKIFSKTLQKMEFYFSDRILIQSISLNDYCDSKIDISHLQDLDFIHEFNKSIKGIECAVVLFELPGENVRISLRSNANLDIVQPIKKLGGGGHPNAAGALIRGKLEDVKRNIVSLLEESLMAKDTLP